MEEEIKDNGNPGSGKKKKVRERGAAKTPEIAVARRRGPRYTGKGGRTPVDKQKGEAVKTPGGEAFAGTPGGNPPEGDGAASVTNGAGFDSVSLTGDGGAPLAAPSMDVQRNTPPSRRKRGTGEVEADAVNEEDYLIDDKAPPFIDSGMGSVVGEQGGAPVDNSMDLAVAEMYNDSGMWGQTGERTPIDKQREGTEEKSSVRKRTSSKNRVKAEAEPVNKLPDDRQPFYGTNGEPLVPEQKGLMYESTKGLDDDEEGDGTPGGNPPEGDGTPVDQQKGEQGETPEDKQKVQGDVSLGIPAGEQSSVRKRNPDKGKDTEGKGKTEGGEGVENKGIHDEVRAIHEKMSDDLGGAIDRLERELAAYSRETEDQRKRRERGRKASLIIAAVSDCLTALTNLYFTTQYAPSVKITSETLMSENLRKWYDKLDAQRRDAEKAREKLEERIFNMKVQKGKTISALLKMEEGMINKEFEMKIKAKDAEAREKKNILYMRYLDNKIEKSEYDTEKARIESENAEEKARLEKEKKQKEIELLEERKKTEKVRRNNIGKKGGKSGGGTTVTVTEKKDNSGKVEITTQTKTTKK